jgi:Ca-activated chloride channel family protein
MHLLSRTQRNAWFIACVTFMVFCGLCLARTAHAGSEVKMKAHEAQSGTLLFKSKDGGETFAVLRQSTDVTIRVSGIVARAIVRQTFRNPHDDWYEGIYVFPLPENAAVDHLKMRIGDRVVQGVIKEKAAAKAAYEQAKAGGQRAALLEQERPNLFTSSVANIGPREEITVELEYQQTLRYDNGHFSLRFPTVLTPRYSPGGVPDAARITPPLPLTGSLDEPLNPLTLNVVLDAGVPLAAVDSPYHEVKVKEVDAQRREIHLEGKAWATRDFELTWTPVATQQPQAALFTEQKDGKTYGLLMVMPPAAAAVKSLPREVIYIIETSGSMEGASIVQAREALQMAVERLGANDTFNVIEFNSYAKALFEDARPASRNNIATAVNWVKQLRAQGGTEMALALNLALNGKESPDRVRQVIFLTDGAVGNEEQLFKLIAEKLGDSRLFTVGIGSAPNSHFMSKAAQTGRGTFTYIGKVEEVKEKMATLFAKLESPVLKGVQVVWPQSQVEAWPQRVPDLYLGEPIVVSAALNSANGEVKLSGLNGDAPWQTTLTLATAHTGAGMGVLWARGKIEALTDGLREGKSEDDVRPAVVQVALAHHLISKYTSLVAVDQTPARRVDDLLKSGAVPVNLPDGAVQAAIFGEQPGEQQGELPQGATDVRFNLMLGLVLLVLASVPSALRQARRRVAV